MSYYKMDINGNINLSDYSNINDYIDVVGRNDKLSINLNNKDNENFNILCSLLEQKGFNIINKSENKHILASRNR